jgi:hypothetical protein
MNKWRRSCLRGNPGKAFNIEPEQTASIDLTGSGVITHIWLVVFPVIQSFDELRSKLTQHKEMYRDITIEFVFDNTVSRVPLADLILCGHGYMESFYTQHVSVMQLICPEVGDIKPNQGVANLYFKMPFCQSASIKIINHNIYTMGSLMQVEWREQPQELPEYFSVIHNAKSLSNENMPIANIAGSGSYFGTGLFIEVNSDNYIAHWWNEHIDKIIVDGESFIGTGLEDYFGYAFGFRQMYFAERAGMTYMEPRSGTWGPGGPIAKKGTFSLFRFHDENPINFNNSFSFDFVQEGSIAKFFDISYRSVSFLYLKNLYFKN